MKRVMELRRGTAIILYEDELTALIVGVANELDRKVNNPTMEVNQYWQKLFAVHQILKAYKSRLDIDIAHISKPDRERFKTSGSSVKSVDWEGR